MSAEGNSTAVPASSRPASREPREASSDQEVLRVDGVCVSFGGLDALSDVRFGVASGELRAILGPNGAGKSTLFGVIAGSIRPTKGRVILRGRDITGLSANKVQRAGISRAFQTPSVFPKLTLAENVWLSLGSGSLRRWNPFANASREAMRSEAVQDALGLVGLGSRARDKAGTLSHADQKLLDMAIAYAAEPTVLLLDEPTQGVSPGEVDRIRSVIVERLRDTTVVMIEHNVDVAMAIADRVIVLDRGSVIADGLPREVAADRGVQRAYLGTDLLDRDDEAVGHAPGR